MKIFKFELKDLVYYMKENKVHSAPVRVRMYIDCTSSVHLALSDGVEGVRYKTCHGIYTEENLFHSKEELLASL